jgi:hypothetical protein
VFTSAIINGTLRIFYGRRPGKCFSVPGAVFAFLSQVIKKYPATGRPIIEAIIRWFEESVLQPAPLLDPIAVALAAGVFDEALARRFATIAHGILRKCDARDGEEIKAVTKAIAALFVAFPRALDPINALLQTYVPLVRSAVEFPHRADGQSEKEEEGFENDLMESMPLVCQLIIEVCRGSPNVAIDQALLVDVVRLMPFQPGVQEQSAILNGMVQLFESNANFKCIAAPFARVLVQLLTWNEKGLDEFKFSRDLITRLKRTLKQIVKADKTLETSITQLLKSSKAKLDRFRALTE